MSTTTTITAPAQTGSDFKGNWCDPRAQVSVASYDPSEKITVTRAAGNSGIEYVFVEEGSRLKFWLSREQAVDFAEAVHNVSGMASSSYAAQFLAGAIRGSMRRKGVTQARVCAETGITRYRLRKILSAEVPMTHDELVAISEVTG